MFVSKSFFGVILHLGVSNFFKSQCQSLKSGSRSLAVSNSPFYTPSFALFLFSISRLAFFISEIIVILNTCSDSQKKLLCKLYHWTSKKTQKVCFHFNLLLDYFHNCTLELSWEWDLEDVVSFSIIILHASVMWRFLMLVSRKLGLLLDHFTFDSTRGKNPDIQISFVKFWKIK